MLCAEGLSALGQLFQILIAEPGDGHAFGDQPPRFLRPRKESKQRFSEQRLVLNVEWIGKSVKLRLCDERNFG